MMDGIVPVIDVGGCGPGFGYGGYGGYGCGPGFGYGGFGGFGGHGCGGGNNVTVVPVAGGGYGGYGYGGNHGCGYGHGGAEIAGNAAFDALNTIQNQVQQQTIADLQGTSQLNTSILQSGFATQAAIACASREAAECCCDTRQAVAAGFGTIALEDCKNTGLLTKTICDEGVATRALITANEMDNLRTQLSKADDKIASLKSQQHTAALLAAQEAKYCAELNKMQSNIIKHQHDHDRDNCCGAGCGHAYHHGCGFPQPYPYPYPPVQQIIEKHDHNDGRRHRDNNGRGD